MRRRKLRRRLMGGGRGRGRGGLMGRALMRRRLRRRLMGGRRLRRRSMGRALIVNIR
jgi:hypothetical protein